MPQDWINGLAGGALIGIAAALLLLLNGRIAGISGALGRLLTREGTPRAWREDAAFIAGLALAPLLYGVVVGAPAIVISASMPVLVVAGLLVGFGARLGSGCTSGHGVCGISRFSKRSIIATCVFMAAAALTVYAARHMTGGG